jgi:hypothetical protein
LTAKPTGDTRACDHYLEILLDSGFALAHAGIANVCGVV